ncbi:hypothetical protein GNP59_07330 [Aliivibrio fischeri]|nr:hypothetical protein [Aliivibrio fischeri]MUL14310.1 hypothetical protein [Aliivibrio fischeri]
MLIFDLYLDKNIKKKPDTEFGQTVTDAFPIYIGILE